MISSISWVPRGVAATQPKKYEISPIEQELISKIVQEHDDSDDNNNIDIIDDDNDDNADDIDKPKQEQQQSSSSKPKTVLPKVDSSGLPPELRMDEYSDDDEDNDVVAGMNLGRMLIADNDNDDNNNDRDDELGDAINSEDDSQRKGNNDQQHDNNDDDDDDSSYGSDDNLDDVPDTREFMPINIDGLQAMNIGGAISGGGGVRKSKNRTDADDDMMDNDDIDDDDDDDDDDSTEVEDTKIHHDTDAIVLVAKTEDDFPSLEVHVYDTRNGNLFVHHDISLPAFPLCVAHGRFAGSTVAGNYAAIGTFHPGIEIWNLDVLNPLEPTTILGGTTSNTVANELLQYQMLNQGGSGKKNKKNKNKIPKAQSGLRPGSHTDAVLSLSWNTIQSNVLASGSADNTVKLWDVTSSASEPSMTFNHHTNKVQSVRWNPSEATLLATGSYDRTVSLVDARSNSNIKTVSITADCEGLQWDPHKNELLTVLADDGRITCWDVRQFNKKTPVWSFVASDYGGISDLSYSPHVPGLLATCSTVSKTVSLWDTYKLQSDSYVPNVPHLLTSKDLCGGKLYTVSFYPSMPWILGTGGSGNQLSLWDLSAADDSKESAMLHTRFSSRLKQGQQASSGSNTLSSTTAGLFPTVTCTPEATTAIESVNNPPTTFNSQQQTNKSSTSNKKKNKPKQKKKVHKSGI